MYTILFIMLIGIVVSIYNCYNGYWNDVVDYILNAVMGVMIGGVIGFLVAIILPMDLYEKQYSYKVESLQDGNSIHGSFFLGCGQIDGKMKYVFYYEENGLYQMKQLDTDKVKIKYTESSPIVNVTEISPTKSFLNKIAIDFDCFDKTYIIEVPKGTIKNNYNLDAQ